MLYDITVQCEIHGRWNQGNGFIQELILEMLHSNSELTLLEILRVFKLWRNDLNLSLIPEEWKRKLMSLLKRLHILPLEQYFWVAYLIKIEECRFTLQRVLPTLV